MWPEHSQAQSEAPYAYLIRFESPITEHQHKVLWEVFADQPWLYRMATDATKSLLKVMTVEPLNRAQADDLVEPTGAHIRSMQDLHSGQFLGASFDLGLGLALSPGQPQDNAGYGAAKSVWLAQHPHWRRENPPQDQLPPDEE